jgi:hypothetical protein
MIVQRATLLFLWTGCSLMGVPEHPPSPDAGNVLSDAGIPPDPCAPNPCTEPLKGQCTAVDGEAVCLCDEEARALGDVCLPVEACEDGDCAGGATTLVRGEPIEGSLNRNGGDTSDWYVLSTPSSGGIERIRIDLIGESGPDAVRGEGETPPGLPNIKLFIAPGFEEPVRQVPRTQVQEDGRFHRFLSADIAAGSVLLLRLDDADELPVTYQVLADPVVADDHADGEDAASAAEAGNHDFVLETREDTDVFVLQVETEGALLASITLEQPNEDPGAVSMRIGSIGGNDHRRYYGRARHTVTPGRYSLRIDHRDARLVGGQLHLRLLSSDDHGDRAEEASPISAGRGELVQGTLVSDDTDWFAFRAEEGSLYRIVYNGIGTLQGRRADDAQFVWDHAVGEIYRHDGLAGEVVLEVGGAEHDYTLMIMNSELADPAGNRMSTAFGLEESEDSFEFALEYAGDVDYLGPFIGEADLCFGLIEPFANGLQAELIDAEGQRLAVVPALNNDRIIEQSLDFGFHYIRVFRAPDQAGAYPAVYGFHANMLGCP